MSPIDTNRLVISNRPVFAWVFGLIFVLAGIFMAIQGTFLMALIFGGIGLLVALLSGFGSQLVLDKTEGVARLIKYTIGGKQVREVLLEELSTAEVRRTGQNTYRIELLLTNGESLPLTAYSTSGQMSKQLQADKIRTFLGPQKPGDRVAALLGVSAVKDQLAQQMYQPRPVQSVRGAEESGTAEGVNWEIQRLRSASGGKITRWFSEGAKLPGSFVMLVQGGGNQPSSKGLGGLLGSLSQLVYKQYIGMYQIGSDETPDLESAQAVQNLDPRLASNFISLTNDSFAARQMLNPWTVGPLANWAARHPAGGMQVMRDNTYGPMLVLFSPRGVTIAFAGQIDQAEMIEEITQLGVELVKANSTN
jgi:hypothetical protein